MKANVKKSGNKNNEIILSIGMIVKNEEKVLERCLQSLQPLMSVIPSEVIIADTGSTDSTVEIAKKYTENVFHFEWINDFAAARNSTLKRAKGKWYFFIDADEYLDDDIHEMVDFFRKPDVYMKVCCAYLSVRNYTDATYKNFEDVDLPRLHRIVGRKKEVKFICAVHESIPTEYPDAKFTTILHHTGYLYNSNQEKIRKKIRNEVLMKKELEKNQEDVRMIAHIIRGETDNSEKEKLLEHALKILNTSRDYSYNTLICVQAASFYVSRKPEKTLLICDICLKDENEYNIDQKDESIIITFSHLRAKSLILLYRYEESKLEFERYFQLYIDYKNSKRIKMNGTGVVTFCSEEFCYKSLYDYVICLKNIGLFSEIDNVATHINYKDLTESIYFNMVEIIGLVYIENRRYNKLIEFYTNIVNSVNEKNKIVYIVSTLENLYFSIGDLNERFELAKLISSSDFEFEYANSMRIIVSENKSTFLDDLKIYLEKINDWKSGVAEIVYISIKYDIDLTNYIKKMDMCTMKNELIRLANAHDDFASYILNYSYMDCFDINIKAFYFKLCLYEIAAVKCFNLTESERLNAYYNYVNVLADYTFNLYNIDNIEEDEIDILSDIYKFGYFMYKAIKSLESGDKIGYISKMKAALVCCESMKDIVKVLLDDFREKNNLINI